MIHVVRQKTPNFPPDIGRTRTTIAGFVVEWSVVQPTAQQVLDFMNPPPAALQAQRAAEAAALVTGLKPEDVRFRALMRATYKALKLAVPGMTMTAAQFRASILAEMPTDDPAN